MGSCLVKQDIGFMACLVKQEIRLRGLVLS
jgi:hypothetical protein